MHIDLIDDYARFQALEADWNAVYDADPEAHFFLSWTWMSTWLDRHQDGPSTKPGWNILVARSTPAGPVCAILPLRFRMKGEGPRAQRQLVMAGRRFADYTGVLCHPRFESEATGALAESVKTLAWSQWELECVRQSPGRLRRILEAFPQSQYSITSIVTRNAGEETDNSICPYVDLPGDWDAYLSQSMSSNTRQKIRRLLRSLDGGAQLRITHASPATIERDIKILLHFWKKKWQQHKKGRLQSILQLNATILRRNFDKGSLFLPVLIEDRRPLGALAFFIDRRRKELLFSIAGRDEDYRNFSPGLLLHAYCLRFAISNGCKSYDFLRGNEPYKYSFGAQERRIRSFAIARR